MFCFWCRGIFLDANSASQICFSEVHRISSNRTNIYSEDWVRVSLREAGNRSLRRVIKTFYSTHKFLAAKFHLSHFRSFLFPLLFYSSCMLSICTKHPAFLMLLRRKHLLSKRSYLGIHRKRPEGIIIERGEYCMRRWDDDPRVLPVFLLLHETKNSLKQRLFPISSEMNLSPPLSLFLSPLPFLFPRSLLYEEERCTGRRKVELSVLQFWWDFVKSLRQTSSNSWIRRKREEGTLSSKKCYESFSFSRKPESNQDPNLRT